MIDPDEIAAVAATPNAIGRASGMAALLTRDGQTAAGLWDDLAFQLLEILECDQT